MVQGGQVVAELTLDLLGQQRYTQALASYQSAQNSLASAKANLYTTQSDMLNNWKMYYDTATNSTYQNSDGSPNTDKRALVDFVTLQNDWLASEAKYKIALAQVTQSQTALSSSWISLQQASPLIYAPISGKVSGFSLQPGTVLLSSSTSSTTSVSNTKVANIETNANPLGDREFNGN